MGHKKNKKYLQPLANLKHGHVRNHKMSSTYNSWRAMKGRCNNPRNCRYKYYGLLGITFDPVWNDFHQFLLDMGVKQNGQELHRKNKKKNYNKNNCEWLDKSTHHELHQKERDYSKDFSNRM